jgi:uncharacterized membrane protein YphA (DoxX/SURF4 family)
MSLIRFLARPMVGASYVADGVDVIRNPDKHVELAAPIIAKVSDVAGGVQIPATTVVRAAGGQLAGAGVLMSLGIFPRLAAAAAAVILAPVTALGYQFWKISDPTERAQTRQGFLAHLALLGGALLVLASGSKKHAHKDKAPGKAADKPAKAHAAGAAARPHGKSKA